MLLWFDRYIRSVFSSNGESKKGDDLKVPMDAAFNIAIRLFSIIDSGSDGADDKLADDLRKIKIKYLGSNP